jgi:hypothetical protein
MQHRSTPLALIAAAGCGWSGHDPGDGPTADAPRIDGAVADAAGDGATDADPCIAPYVRTAFGCHHFPAVPADTTGAATICAGAFGGGLPIVDTVEESVYLGQTALGADTLGRVWLGLTNVAGTWTWRDGTPATLTAWVTGEPSGTGPCAVLRNDGTWGDRLCTDLMTVVCELP